MKIYIKKSLQDSVPILSDLAKIVTAYNEDYGNDSTEESFDGYLEYLKKDPVYKFLDYMIPEHIKYSRGSYSFNKSIRNISALLSAVDITIKSFTGNSVYEQIYPTLVKAETFTYKLETTYYTIPATESSFDPLYDYFELVNGDLVLTSDESMVKGKTYYKKQLPDLRHFTLSGGVYTETTDTYYKKGVTYYRISGYRPGYTYYYSDGTAYTEGSKIPVYNPSIDYYISSIIGVSVPVYREFGGIYIDYTNLSNAPTSYNYFICVSDPFPGNYTYYEKNNEVYTVSTDTEPVSGKTYYYIDTPLDLTEKVYTLGDPILEVGYYHATSYTEGETYYILLDGQFNEITVNATNFDSSIHYLKYSTFYPDPNKSYCTVDSISKIVYTYDTTIYQVAKLPLNPNYGNYYVVDSSFLDNIIYFYNTTDEITKYNYTVSGNYVSGTDYYIKKSNKYVLCSGLTGFVSGVVYYTKGTVENYPDPNTSYTVIDDIDSSYDYYDASDNLISDPTTYTGDMYYRQTPKEDIVKYLTHLFYSVKGTCKVIDYLIGYTEILGTAQIEYNQKTINIVLEKLDYKYDSDIFEDYLIKFLGSLLYFTEINLTIGNVKISIDKTTESSIVLGANYYKLYDTWN